MAKEIWPPVLDMDIDPEDARTYLWKRLKKLALDNGKDVEVTKRILRIVAEIEDLANDMGYYIGRCDS